MRGPLHPSTAGRSSGRLVGSLLAGTLFLATAVPCQAAPGREAGPEAWPHLERIREIVVPPLKGNAVDDLAALGPSAAPTVWAILSGQALTEVPLDRASTRSLFRECISSWPDSEVVDALVAAPDRDTPLSSRLVLLEMLSWTDSDAALTGIFVALEGVEPVLFKSGRVTRAVVSSLEPLLAAKRGRFRLLSELLGDLPRELLPAVIEAVGGVPGIEGLRILMRSAAYGGELEFLVLTELARSEYRVSPGSTEECAVFARRFVDSFEVRERRLAARALGRLRDAESFSELIELVEDDDTVVARVAQESLRDLTGLTRSWSTSRWQTWWDSELSWSEAAVCYRDVLLRAAPFEAKGAIRELASHRLLGGQMVDLLAYGLENPASEVRQGACAGLARLQHPAGILLLIEALEDGDDSVRAAAHEGLETLTGVDLGTGAAAWQSWWESV